MDLESLNQSQEENGDTDQSFAMIDPTRIQALTEIMKFLCNVINFFFSQITYLNTGFFLWIGF